MSRRTRKEYMMPDILVNGQWERLSLVSDGAVHISLVSAVAARLEVSGTARPPKYLGPAHDVAAFPTGAVADSEPVSIRARTVTGDQFPGDGVIDLAVAVSYNHLTLPASA